MTDAPARASALVASHREAVREIVVRNRGRNPRLYGVAARGEDPPGGNLDLLIDLDESASLFDLVRMNHELEELLGIRVDVLDVRSLRGKSFDAVDDALPL